MNNLTFTKLNFSQHLTEVLLAKYKKQVSAVFFVNQFNLRAYGTNTIAYETGRKWLKGIAIPQLSKMKVLIDWLDLDPNYLFMSEEVSNGQSKTSITNSSTLILSEEDKHHSPQSIQEINKGLDINSQQVLWLSALTLRQLAEASSN